MDTTPDRPARTMDDITRLYMADARPATDAAPARLPLVQLAICAVPGDGGWNMLQTVAQHLAAEQRTAVGLVGVHRGVLRLLRAGDQRDGALAAAQRTGPLDIQIARALYGMQENVGLWLIALPLGPAMDHLLACVRDWLLVTSDQDEAVIAGYRSLKNIVAGDPVEEARTVRVFLQGSAEGRAAVVQERLRRAASEFLKQDLLLAGVGSGRATPVQTMAEFVLKDQEPAAWSSVGEFLHDLAQDTGESASEPEVTAAVPITAEPVAASSETPVAEPVPAAPIAPQPACKVDTSLPKIVEIGSFERGEQWRIALLTAGEEAIRLELTPPGTGEAAFFVDPVGGLHLWMMADDASRWLNVWHWARRHEALLTLTRCERPIAAKPLAIHVLIPQGCRVAPVALPGVTWHRVLGLRVGERLGAVIVGAEEEKS